MSNDVEPLRVFISYAEADTATAELLYGDLSQAGAEVFQFSQSASAGVPSWAEIVLKIASSDVFVLLVSHASNVSRAVQTELEYAFGSRVNTNKPGRVIPALLKDGIEIPVMARGFNWVSVVDYPAGVIKLLTELGLKQQVMKVPIQGSEYRRAFSAGYAAAREGNVEVARREYRRAAEIDTTASWPLTNLGILLRVEGEMSEAEMVLREALTRNPSDVKALMNLGHLLERSGRVNEAIPLGEKAAQLEPTDIHTHDHLGKWLTDVGRFDDALKEIDAALAIEPGNGTVLANKSRALQVLGRFEEALAYATEGAEVLPEDTRVLNILATSFASIGRFTDSLQALDRAIAIQESADLRYNHGVASALLGQYDDALSDIRAAYEMGFHSFELTEAHPYLATFRLHPYSKHRLEALIAEFKHA